MSRFLRLTELEAYVPGEQPKGMGGIIKLNTNESPFPPSPKAVNAITRAEVEKLRLYPDPTCSGLASAIGERYSVSEKQICVCNSSDEVLAFTFHGMCAEGALFPDITYGFYPVFCGMFGVSYEEIPLRDDFSISVDDYAGKKGTVFIANPNAPTGLLLKEAEIRRLLEQDNDRLVVIDEAYVDFGGKSMTALIPEYDNLMVVQTFSKSRQLAGGRLGFAIGSEDIIRDMNTLKFSFNPYNVNRLTMIAGEAAMRDYEYFDKCRNEIIKNRAYVTRELKRLGFKLTDSMANFVFASPPQISGEEYFKRLKENGILVRYFGNERTKDYVRITIGTRRDMETLIAVTEKILEGEG